MKKSTYAFLITAVFAAGVIIYGWVFVSHEIGTARLTEETVAGDRQAADGLIVAFRTDSADTLHWINGYDYSAHRTVSLFTRGEMATRKDAVVYDDFRFTGWSRVPYYTKLSYDGLDGLQNEKLHKYYDRLQEQVVEDGRQKSGIIRLCDYMKYYPVSFRFQFGEKVYHSSNMLKGMKAYDAKGVLTEENAAAYAEDLKLYRKLHDYFKIPVIQNEYQKYSISRKNSEDKKRTAESEIKIAKPLNGDGDYYEFDPIITLQQENIRDGKDWEHPDLADRSEKDQSERDASSYGLKNRLFFVPNNRTVKEEIIDSSQIKEGYGIYELPIDTAATISIGKGRKNPYIPDPKPLSDQLRMVYRLDENAEYVEISLSPNHRHMAVFSIKDNSYCAEIVDADMWKSICTAEMFPASETMTYAWGEDGTLAVTDLQGHVALFTGTEDNARPYKAFYRGEVTGALDRDLFTGTMISKRNAYGRYQYGIDHGLAVAAAEDKVALVQNSPVSSAEPGYRNADLMCVVIDKTGVVYTGRLKSNLVDIEDDITEKELAAIERLAGGSAGKDIIKPVGNENRAAWKAR